MGRDCFSDGLLFHVVLGNLLLERDCKSKSGATSGFAFRSDMSSHQLDKLFTDGQSQPGSPIFSSGGPIRLHKRLEESRKRTGCNSDSVICHGETDMSYPFMTCRRFTISGGGEFKALFGGPVIKIHQDGNRPLVAEFNRIRQQIAENLLKPSRIAA